MSTEKIKEIQDKIYSFTKNDKAGLAEKMMRNFNVNIYYCDICDYVYFGSSFCNVTDHNVHYHREINDLQKFDEIIKNFNELNDMDAKAEIVQDILSDEFGKNISYCEKCEKMSNNVLCTTTECPQDKIWSIYPM